MQSAIITPPPFKHKEAFALMYYENKETKMGFVVWNSRDGVTPFIVFEDGKEYMHAHWGLDRVPNTDYINRAVLVPGQRIFRDTTPEEAKAFAEQRIRNFKGTKYEVEENSERWHELVQSLSADFINDPTMVKVKEDKTF